MLDSRTSDVPTRVADPTAPRTTGARPPDGLAARTSTPGDLSFDSVLSDALSDRVTVLRPRRHVGRTNLCEGSDPAAPSRRAVPRKPGRRERASEAAEEMPGDASRVAPQPSSHRQDAAAADTPAPVASHDSQGPPAADVQPASPPDPTATDAAGQGMTPGAGDAAGHVVAATTGMPASDAADEVSPVSEVTGQGGTPGQTLHAPVPAAMHLEPLQRIAAQQASRVNAAIGLQQAGVAAESAPTAELAADAVPAPVHQTVVRPGADAVGEPSAGALAELGDQVGKPDTGLAANPTADTRGNAGAKPTPATPRTGTGPVAIAGASADAPLEGETGDQTGTPADSGDDRRPGQAAVTDLTRTARRASTAFDSLPLLRQEQADSIRPDPKPQAKAWDQSASGPSMTVDPAGLLNRSDPVPTGVTGGSPAPHTTTHVVTAPVSQAQPDAATYGQPDDGAVRNMQRLATVVYAAVGRQQSVARMQLQPPELGAVTAVVQMRHGRMDLKMEVASESARDLVTGGLDRLRDILQQQGISLDRVAVSVAPRSEHASTGQQQSAWGGHPDHAWGQFNPGQGHQQDERGLGAWQAADVPAEVAVGQGDLAVAAVSYGVGLNVLA